MKSSFRTIIPFIPILALLFASLSISFGQTPCSQYQKILENIRTSYEAKKYEESLQHIKAARACAPSHEAEIESWNDKVFVAIQKQRDDIEQQRATAVSAKNRAERLSKYFFAADNQDLTAWAYGPNNKFGVIDR